MTIIVMDYWSRHNPKFRLLQEHSLQHLKSSLCS
jgi:hypothetical protein